MILGSFLSLNSVGIAKSNPAPPVTDFFLLLADGSSFLLLADGTSKLIIS
jgi:hypothetical protein